MESKRILSGCYDALHEFTGSEKIVEAEIERKGGFEFSRSAILMPNNFATVTRPRFFQFRKNKGRQPRKQEIKSHLLCQLS